MNYGVMYEFFIDRTHRSVRSTHSTTPIASPRPPTPGVVTPTSDTPYSFVGMDLRRTHRALRARHRRRCFSVQLVDMYTFNYGYMGSRTTGNNGGCFMIAGPSWTGQTPAGISKVYRCETDFCLAIIRTQLFNAADIDNVKKVQAGYKAQPLSQFLNSGSPAAAPAINWPAAAELIEKTLCLSRVLRSSATGPAVVTPARSSQ
jgi:hypothetical protein